MPVKAAVVRFVICFSRLGSREARKRRCSVREEQLMNKDHETFNAHGTQEKKGETTKLNQNMLS